MLSMESKLKQKNSKACYKTSEWSKNSGICCNCELQEDCGEIEEKPKVKGEKS